MRMLAAPYLCCLPLGCIDHHAELVLVVLACCFHRSLAAGFDFDYLCSAVTIFIFIHHEEIWNIYALLASHRISIRYLHCFTCPLYDVGMVIAEHHERVFPTASICWSLGSYVFFCILQGKLTLCELAHELMFLTTY